VYRQNVLGLKLLTIKEIADILSVKEKTLYQWAELGQIPCIKLNGVLRFSADDIGEWITSCKKAVTSSYNPLTKLEARKGGKNQ
jgi:excisionase family DNA binding protein